MTSENDVASDVSIASLRVRLCELGQERKQVILLAQMNREELRKGVAQNFQSCTFNRSVTSPIKDELQY